jgi:type I restriction enzyme S subunit
VKNNHTPEIRFPGLTGDWEQRKLGEISEKVTEKNKNNIYSETLTNSAEFGIINQRDFFDKDISNEKNLDGYYVVRPDDFVYNPRISNHAPVGPIKRNKLGRTGVMSPLYYVFRTHGVDKTYLEKYFSANNWHMFMKMNGDSGARSDRFAIKDSLFREMLIPIPSIEAQTKIGNLFTQLDEAITLYQKELTIIKQTKQGFLQKMFPKEGETVPKLRFSGFIGAWEESEVKDFSENTLGGGTPRTTNKEYWDGNTPWIQSSDLNEHQVSGVNAKKRITESGLRNSAAKLVSENSIAIVTRVGVGKIALMEYEYTTSQDFLSLSNLKVDKWFGVYSLYTLLQKELHKVQGTSIKGITKNELLEKKLCIPTSHNEQVKIGNFFKEIDENIALQQQELKALQQTKKAFLQKMFV